jgi:hypothetical protein
MFDGCANVIYRTFAENRGTEGPRSGNTNISMMIREVNNIVIILEMLRGTIRDIV